MALDTVTGGTFYSSLIGMGVKYDELVKEFPICPSKAIKADPINTLAKIGFHSLYMRRVRFGQNQNDPIGFLYEKIGPP